MRASSFGSSRILQPVRPWFIMFSLLAALMLNCLPTSVWYGVPDWVALVLVFWGVREPRHVGMGTAFCLGMAMDVADASLLGQHALAYVLAVYMAGTLSRRILWFQQMKQALHALPILLAVQGVQLLVRMSGGGDFPGFAYFLAALTATALWPVATFLLMLPQYQPVERDENRPI